ncbi:hypothetical protein [Mucilaginibacter kameinonensis]|uniref:hypothetical protein n=1 Tax=Mucilaginibacter kameinonensis TaxID=452286 RepID=UPI000EF7B03B|nr:hypothetical protein [Mucilaginibacter kameinonensis]
MKKIKKLIRLCGLIVFMILAVAGIGILGVAPTLTKDRKLFADEYSKTIIKENNESEPQSPDE